ncbi:hypothetical protein D9M72_488730 [compost metagenome]
MPHVIQMTLDDRSLDISAPGPWARALDLIQSTSRFELWVSVPDGPSMCMLRNGENAWLMYLREPGDSGFRSSGDPHRPGLGVFTLSNGQVDEYPLAWCIDVAHCRQALVDFRDRNGARPESITWCES